MTIGDRGELIAKDLKRRDTVRRLYRVLGPAWELAENNYYNLPLSEQGPELIEANRFWLDLAKARARGGSEPFLSAHFAEATSTLTEILCALAVLDLPFDAEPPKAQTTDGRLTIEATSDVIVLHQELLPTTPDESSSILVNQSYFEQERRHEYIDGEKQERFITDEFLAGTVYGCQIVLTNPTSHNYDLTLLAQVPNGSIPLSTQGTRTIDKHVKLDRHSTELLEYLFYFPYPDTFPHCPVQLASRGKHVGAAPPKTLQVVARLTKPDTQSWENLSQSGSAEDVLRYLEENNLLRLDLDRLAWRFRDPKSYQELGKKVLDLLRRRHLHNPLLWSYGIHHNDPTVIREYLGRQQSLVSACGQWLQSPLLTVEPIERGLYEHLEYSPLINARAHRLGTQPRITNQFFLRQYLDFLDVLSHKPQLDDAERLAVAYAMFLQDRVEEGLHWFGRVDRAAIHTEIQYDYLAAYAALYNMEPRQANAIALKYMHYPVGKWRNRFLEVLRQVGEIEGRVAPSTLEEDSSPTVDQLAAREPILELEVEDRRVAIRYRNVDQVQFNYYPMDIELLFSSQPFMKQSQGTSKQRQQWSFVQPLRQDTQSLSADENEATFDLPEEFRRANVLIEAVGAGLRRSQAYYANNLSVAIRSSYGDLKLTHRDSGDPVAAAYVKVYAKSSRGRVLFYKDGYTDLRGRFNYLSLNTTELDSVNRFALLILSNEQGALVREVKPPLR